MAGRALIRALRVRAGRAGSLGAVADMGLMWVWWGVIHSELAWS